MTDLTAFELERVWRLLADTELKLAVARKTMSRMIQERRRNLQYYRWAVVSLVLLNCVFYGAWLTDKMGWM